MNFYNWMKAFRGENTPMGDLAADMKRQGGWTRVKTEPTPEGKKAILSRLMSCGACDECVEAFEDAWDLYVDDTAGRAR